VAFRFSGVLTTADALHGSLLRWRRLGMLGGAGIFSVSTDDEIVPGRSTGPSLSFLVFLSFVLDVWGLGRQSLDVSLTKSGRPQPPVTRPLSGFFSKPFVDMPKKNSLCRSPGCRTARWCSCIPRPTSVRVFFLISPGWDPFSLGVPPPSFRPFSLSPFARSFLI